MATLVADIRVGETIRIEGSGTASITLAAKSGQRAKLQIERDTDLRIVLPERDSVRRTVAQGLAKDRKLANV